jgi:ATP-dependent DNA helicase RecQ
LWGHDFRPDYLFLQEARAALGNPATLAMTATAPPRVRDEILDYMRADAADVPETESVEVEPQRPRVLALDIFRSNLHLSALRFHNEDEKLAAAVKFVTETEGSGIIYVNTRHKSESLAAALRAHGVLAESYHAGMENRGAIQDRFMSNKTRVVIATVAFGMGIDKPDIRFILHFHPSRSLAGYYQEVGRAGRDGKPSQGVLFYSNNDWANLRRWARADEYDATFLMRVLAAVGAQLGVAEGTAHDDLDGAVDARRLQSVLNVDETTIRVAISILERADLLRRGFDVAQDITVTLPRKSAMPAAAAKDDAFGDLLKGLALSPGQSAGFRLNDIASFMGWNLSDCELMLLEWQAKGFLKVKLARRAMFIELPAQPADAQARLERILTQSQALGNRRIDDIAGYATTEGCRHGYISAHFGSPPRIRCTVCDNCTGIRPDLPVPVDLPHLLPDDADLEPMILDCLVSLPRTVGRGGLARILAGSLRAPYTPDKARHHGALKAMGEGGVLEYIDDLLESGRLRQYERQGFMVLGTTVSGRAEAEAWLAEHPDLNQFGEAPLAEEGEQEVETAERFTALQKAVWLWRRRLAEEFGQPAYVVMSNETLIQIAETRPATLEALAVLPGMGEQRLNRYGETILDLVRLHPVGADDEALLKQQRAQLAVAKENLQPKRTSVSPRAERRIYMKMQELRQQIAVQGKGKYAEVASNTLLKEIAGTGPATLADLEALPGFRSSAFAQHAERILATVQAEIGDDEMSDKS